jgi:hypothetical protein
MTEAVLLVASLAAGVTGAWSPCGFSMVETLAPRGYAGRLRTTLVACATFAAGALAGGVITFAGLAVLGRALGAGGTVAVAVAAAVALAAAVGEARGARIVPQVRRQVPESWRRVLPLPAAAGLYGVLLGLGFTTFILSFAVWALAGVSVALGDPALGLIVGLGFGAGRALPVIALAPLAATEAGAAAHAAMAERPAILRALRVADAAALAACAAVLWSAPAQAAGTSGTRTAPARAAGVASSAGAARAVDVFAFPATDPSVDGALLAFHEPGAGGVLDSGGARQPAPGPHPAVGGGRLAWPTGAAVEVRAPSEPAYVVTIPAAGADAVAVAAGWVAWRAREGEDDVLFAAPLPPAAQEVRRVAAASAPVALGRPALAGDRLLFHVAGERSSRIDEVNLTTGKRRVLRRQPRALLLNPSARSGRLLYVRSTSARQQLRLGRLTPRSTRRDRPLYGTVPTGRRDEGHDPGAQHHRHGHPRRLPPRPRPGVADTLWSTALGSDAAYVTRLRQVAGRPVTATLLRVDR